MTTTTNEISVDKDEAPKGRVRSAVSGMIGTTLEFFDLQLYGLAAALVFGRLFFSDLPPALGLISSFATYAIGFLARPVGALFFGWLGDRKGRKMVLVSTVTLMGISTTLIGALPTSDQVGVLAPILLVFLRICQGFGAGAELAGASVLLAEFSNRKNRGLFSSLVCLGTNSGTLLASGVWLIISTLPEEALLTWGWRIPFLSSIFVALFALWIRRTLSETPVFQTVQATTEVADRTPVRDLVKYGRRPFFIALGLRIGENGPSYLLQAFLVGYLVTGLSMEPWIGTAAILVASALAYITIPLAGWISDKIGRRLTYRYLTGLLMLWSFPSWWLLQSREPVAVFVVMIVGLSVGVLSLYSVQSSYFPELFGTRYRYVGLAMSKEIGGVVAGGFAPLIAALLLGAFNNSWIPIAIYMFVLSAIAFVTTFYAPETKGRDLHLVEDAR